MGGIELDRALIGLPSLRKALQIGEREAQKDPRFGIRRIGRNQSPAEILSLGPAPQVMQCQGETPLRGRMKGRQLQRATVGPLSLLIFLPLAEQIGEVRMKFGAGWLQFDAAP